MTKSLDFLSFSGRVGRGAYAVTGFLAFAVKHNLDRLLAQSLMKETSLYGDIKVRHLEDHDFQPERVDFVITRLPNGNSRLEGTTTDQNKMWPGAYWRIWTDGLIHSIHRRVFEYIKQLAEADAGRTAVRQ